MHLYWLLRIHTSEMLFPNITCFYYKSLFHYISIFFKLIYSVFVFLFCFITINSSLKLYKKKKKGVVRVHLKIRYLKDSIVFVWELQSHGLNQ